MLGTDVAITDHAARRYIKRIRPGADWREAMTVLRDAAVRMWRDGERTIYGQPVWTVDRPDMRLVTKQDGPTLVVVTVLDPASPKVEEEPEPAPAPTQRALPHVPVLPPPEPKVRFVIPRGFRGAKAARIAAHEARTAAEKAAAEARRNDLANDPVKVRARAVCEAGRLRNIARRKAFKDADRCPGLHCDERIAGHVSAWARAEDGARFCAACDAAFEADFAYLHSLRGAA